MMPLSNIKNDIVLVIVPRIQDDFGYTPAGAALLKGSLEAAGFSSKILDFNSALDAEFRNSVDQITELDNFFFYNNFYNLRVWNVVETFLDTWARQIIALNPTWVGISVFSYNSHRATRLLSIKLKLLNPDIKIVIGGGGIATDYSFPETLKEQGIIDAYIRGEGELALVELLRGNVDYPGINGRTSEQIKDLDNIPYPNYDDYDLKTYTNRKGLEALPITGSRGCVRNCTFCDVASQWPKYYYRSGQSIANEIIHQTQKYGVTAFRFTDSLINGSLKAFRDMIFTLSSYRETLSDEKKFTWDTHFIVRGPDQMPPNHFDLMKAAGAGTLLIGIESGSENVRNHMKKGFSQQDLDYTMQQLDRVSIKCRMLMIIGYPTETDEDFQLTLDMFDRYVPYLKNGIIEEVNLGLTLNLLKNTPLTDNLNKYNLVQSNSHINNWICKDNPTLDYKKRLRRRIEVQSHCENLGYKVFESANYTKQLFNSWQEVQKLNYSEPKILKNFSFDREKGGLVETPDTDTITWKIQQKSKS
jgi:radical SAM superfamily enzyme YgiQ (UPF0313 family)